jgi:hypothetical protein
MASLDLKRGNASLQTNVLTLAVACAFSLAIGRQPQLFPLMLVARILLLPLRDYDRFGGLRICYTIPACVSVQMWD